MTTMKNDWRISIYLMVAGVRQIIDSTSVQCVSQIDGAVMEMLERHNAPEVEIHAGMDYGFYWAEFADSEGIALRLEVHLEKLWT